MKNNFFPLPTLFKSLTNFGIICAKSFIIRVFDEFYFLSFHQTFYIAIRIAFDACAS